MLHQNLEEALLNAANRLKRGDATAVGDLVDALKAINESQTGLIPLIGSLLKFQDQDVLVFASSALAKFGERASSECEPLINVLRTNTPPASNAAACALGRLKTPEAIIALTDSLQSKPLRELYYVAAGLVAAGTAGLSGLHALQVRSRKPDLDPTTRRALQEAIAALQAIAREQHELDIKQTSLHEYLPLHKGNTALTPAEYYARYSIPRRTEESGEVHCGRFRFNYNGYDCEIGLRIFKLEDGRHAVVTSWDGKAYGVSLTNANEHIATAVSHLYGLDPHRTVWVERYAKSSGRVDEDCALVSYNGQSTDGMLLYPVWRPSPPIGELMRSFGIEW